jgi:polysaccharide biosynthesis/export protein
MMQNLIRAVLVLSMPYQIWAFSDMKYPAPPADFFQKTSRTTNISYGDVLSVRFYYNPELNKTVKVRNDGKISLDLFQGIQALGLTPEELQKQLTEMYSHEFSSPAITVDIDTSGNDVVFVTGEVVLPGMKELHGRMSVAMVLATSEINPKTADTKSVYLIRSLEPSRYNVYRINASPTSGDAPSIEARAGDIFFVPRKRIAQMDDVIDLYIRQLLPATPTASVSVIYTPQSSLVTTATTTTSGK